MTKKLPTELGATGPLAVETRALVKRFGGNTALAGVDVAVPEGCVYVLVGPNGAGKSTTLKVLLDLVVADAGSARVFGLDTHTNGPRVRAMIGYVPERQDAAYGWLRVGELMRYHAGYYASWDAAYASELSKQFAVRPEMRFDRLSKGQQRRVQLLLALAQRPALLVMDEPTDGLDPAMREQMLSTLAGHMARFPTTVLVSTHLVHETERLGDHLGVMSEGRIEVQCTRETLRRGLRRYRMQVPGDWRGAPLPDDVVIRRNDSQREVAWTIWGEESEVSERLRASGATIRQVDPLTLEEAALALLTRQPPTEPIAGIERAAMIPAGV